VSQQENAPNKPVHLIYLCGGLLLFFLIQWSIEWIVGYFTKIPSESTTTIIAAVGALGLTTFFYKSDRAYGRIDEIASELKKVTWPSAKEVRSATIVVIVMSIIAAIILFIFDLTWSKITESVYGG
jgi:preprotein translocase subunit SecE